jgi:predicted histidine transporter YuiF (NhaC family)
MNLQEAVTYADILAFVAGMTVGKLIALFIFYRKVKHDN